MKCYPPLFFLVVFFATILPLALITQVVPLVVIFMVVTILAVFWMAVVGLIRN